MSAAKIGGIDGKRGEHSLPKILVLGFVGKVAAATSCVPCLSPA